MTEDPEPEVKEDPDYEYSLKIKRVNNGYILSYWNDYGVYTEDVIEEGDEEDYSNTVDIKSGLELLAFVLDYFGLDGDKHDKKRIIIDTIIGRDYIGEEYDDQG